MKRKYVGTHLIAELYGCKNNLDDAQLIRSALKGAALVCKATVLHSKFHKFSPKGITGYLLLAESHISIHTWPELNYAAVDIFTCGNMRSEKALRYIFEALGPSKVKAKKHLRG